ncbi:signal peptidase I [Spongiivirga citrea]|uniref:Signal peptidase I n=1 Tax=Spongiivirga citrea TaxID=1481457 RepID=A0A6M0CSY9_9FLAO|nr:signal peptidase I [Spongiivirga citrea]NER19039.1 signal peptidase I [Spongiivirga citrea]
MKLSGKKLAIIGGIIVFIYILFGATGVLRFFKFPTPSSEPTIKSGSYLFSSSLKTPKKGDFIAFKKFIPEFGLSTYAHRLIAVGGDEIEIKDGIVTVNGIQVDKNRELKFSYVLPKAKFDMIAHTTSPDYTIPINENEYLTYLADNVADEYQVSEYRSIQPVGQIDNSIEDIYNQPWNTDQFGPLVIPKDSIFVLGDNRHNALDSRYFGLVAEDAIIGTVLWK